MIREEKRGVAGEDAREGGELLRKKSGSKENKREGQKILYSRSNRSPLSRSPFVYNLRIL